VSIQLNSKIIAELILDERAQRANPRVIQRIKRAGIDDEVLNLRIIDRDRFTEVQLPPDICANANMPVVHIGNENVCAGAVASGHQDGLLPSHFIQWQKHSDAHGSHTFQIKIPLYPNDSGDDRNRSGSEKRKPEWWGK